jgi:LPXTG-site transpeptidase (sortase) family protein
MGDTAAGCPGVVKPDGARLVVSRHRAPGRASIVLLAVVALAAYTGAVGLTAYGLLPRPAGTTWLPAFAPLVLDTGDPPPPSDLPAPTRVRIKKIGVNSALQALHLDPQGALQAPADFGHAGWYADGTLPGEPGPAVIAGHVDSRFGRAVFFRLKELRPGDVIEVQRAQTWVTFRVTEIDKYAKDGFPTAKVYGPTPDAQLRLITCGGRFDHTAHSYVDNLVVYATADVDRQQALP